MKETNIDYLIIPELKLFENQKAANYYLMALYILTEKKPDIEFILTEKKPDIELRCDNVSEKASELYPKESTTYKDPAAVGEILDFLNDNDLITRKIDLSVGRIEKVAITEKGVEIADKCFIPNVIQSKIEKIKSDISHTSNESTAAVILKRIAQSLIDANTSIATQQLLTELKILEKLDEISKKLDDR